MKFKVAYYIAKSGEIFKVCEKFRQDHIAWNKKVVSYLSTIGGVAFKDDWNGRVSSVKFKDKAPQGFKKPDKHGCQEPYVKSDWGDKFKALGSRPLAKNYIAEILKVPSRLNYKTKDSEGSKALGHFFHEYQIGWYSATSPLLVGIADIKKEIKLFYAEYPEGKILNDLESWDLPKGLKEIMVEEWDLMVAKHEKEQENE